MDNMNQIFEYPGRAGNYLSRFFRGKTDNNEANIERPSFSTNIFDEREMGLQNNWFWLFVVSGIFCLGVAASYFLIHYR